ncbi:MAG TPA: hypothetical protein VHS57_04710, partial [Acidimicrobiales bacterium]|nr:hypothetical protein [Acidimicrobiales bacterium]
LPNAAGAALAGDIAGGIGGEGGIGGRGLGFHLLTWWEGGLAMVAWGIVPLVLGYFTTFDKDVT